jgi:pyocin large subunit-like protein
MSVDALKWAWMAPVDTSSERLILLSLADRAGEDHTAWPSTERLVKDTKLNLKTVKDVIARLIEKGFLEDTGKRVGKTGRVRVLRLKGVDCRVNPSENGSIPKQAKHSSNSTEKGSIQSTQNRNDTENGIIPNLPANEPENGSLNEPEIGSQNLPENLSRNLSLEKNKNNADAFLTAAQAKAVWLPDLDNLNELMLEKDYPIVTQTELDAQIVDFNRNNHGKSHTINQLYLHLRAWIANARAKSQAKPAGQKPAKPSKPPQQQDTSQFQTESPIPKNPVFDQRQDWEPFGCGYTVGHIRQNQHEGETPEYCLSRLISEKAKAGTP